MKYEDMKKAADLYITQQQSKFPTAFSVPDREAIVILMVGFAADSLVRELTSLDLASL